MGQRQHEGQVSSQNASICAGRIILCLHASQELPKARQKALLAYEILCISANHCTDRWNRIEKTGMPDALALLNVEDVHHLKCLMWAVYDGILLVGPQPELLGNSPWCTVLAGLQQHIYRGHDDVAHCPSQTLGSWDCQEQIEALRCVGCLSST